MSIGKKYFLLSGLMAALSFFTLFHMSDEIIVLLSRIMNMRFTVLRLDEVLVFRIYTALPVALSFAGAGYAGWSYSRKRETPSFPAVYGICAAGTLLLVLAGWVLRIASLLGMYGSAEVSIALSIGKIDLFRWGLVPLFLGVGAAGIFIKRIDTGKKSFTGQQ